MEDLNGLSAVSNADAGMNEFKCKRCNRLLFKYKGKVSIYEKIDESKHVEIKCKCKHMNYFCMI